MQRKFEFSPKFNPKSFEITSLYSDKNQTYIGSVNFYNCNLETITFAKDNFLHSIAYSNEVENYLCTEIKKKNIKTFLLKEIATFTKISMEDLRLKKDENNIPYVYYGNKALKIPFSISHHGSFSAYVVKFL